MRAAGALLGAALLAASCGGGAPSAPAPGPAAGESAGAACGAFAVQGDPRSAAGATWSYVSVDGGVGYDLRGILFLPSGAGPFPAVVVSHGKGGTPAGYSARIARTMVTWGMAVIAPQYSHAPADTGRPAGADGASPENVLRAHKARDLLSCVNGVDLARVAAHGHSMGAFVTGELVGTYPGDFRAASHTAGGSGAADGAATHPETAGRIVTPYQLHHGDQDAVVPLAQDQALARILAERGTRHQLEVYPGYDHNQIAFDDAMLTHVHAWYAAEGLF